MKSTKQSNKLKSRAVSIVVCAILILCALLSFGLFGMPATKSAAADEPAAKTVNGIRFVQVAAGEDFAIGLTYGGELYGWSLRDDRKGSDRLATASYQTDNDMTLGQYYAELPIKIEVVFRRGPGNGTSALTWNDTSATGYHGVVTGDRIKKIVATRTTAAFLTKDGFIYTWGKDIFPGNEGYSDSWENIYMADMNSVSHYLILREPAESSPWYAPYIIDYGYYSDKGYDNSMNIMRNVTNAALTETDIAAGEYNYIFIGNKQWGNSSYKMSYVWGSLLYSTVQTPISSEYDYTEGSGGQTAPSLQGGDDRRIVSLELSGSTVRNAVAGGYNVGVNRSSADSGMSSLQLRGRNFLSSQIGEGEDKIINTVNAVKAGEGAATSKIKYTQGEYNLGVANGVIGGQGDLDSSSGGLHLGISNNAEHSLKIEGYYGRVPSNSSTAGLTFALNDITKGIQNAQDGDLAVQVNGETKTLLHYAERFGVSLGNDVGYGITSLGGGNSGGVLYAWGDNANGQLSNGVTDAYKQAPVALTITGAARFVSVAAGKQLSSAFKPFYSADTLDLNGSEIQGFNEAVQNEKEFITGALDENGKLFVWSNYDNKPQQIVYGNAEEPQSQNTFLAIYSGYGNNLFAVTKIGKLVKISYDEINGVYVQKYYDDFVTFTKTESGVNAYSNVTNWTVDSTNRVEFRPHAGVSDSNYAPHLGSATLYVWNYTDVAYQAPNEGEEEDADNAALGEVKYTHMVGPNNYADGFNTLVSSNAIGDVYRILGVKNGDAYTGDDGKVAQGRFLSMTQAEHNGFTSFAPVFKFKATTTAEAVVMTEQQRKNMLDFDVVNDGNGVGIKITPKQSTRGGIVVIDFYIARFSSEKNFTPSNDYGVYYDYQKCSVEVVVIDTASARIYNAFNSANNGKSNIPLLDPNNEYNKYYSLAVQDASTGMRQLLAYLGVQENSTENITGTVYGKIVNQVTGEDGSKNEDGTPKVLDRGFPASSKISKGNLQYYLGTDAAAKYNNSYQYLFADRDGDRIVISTPTGTANIITGSNVTAVTGNIATVHVTKIDTGVPLSGDALANKQAALLTDFNNLYGLYNIVLSLSGSNTIEISFDYDIVTVCGEGSTGAVEYTGQGVSSYNTISSREHLNVNIATTVYNVSFVPDGNENYRITGNGRNVNTNNIASVFSNPTLRIGKGMGVDGKVYDGNPNSDHEFTVEYNQSIVVGDTVKININEYFINRNARIMFSYNNSTTQYNNFNNQFVDQTGYGVKTVVLEGESLTVTPTTTEPIHLTITAQRFRDAENTQPFINPASTEGKTIYDEKITINFVFGTKEHPILDFAFASASTNNPSATSQLITRNQTIDILGAPSSFNAGHPFVEVTGLSDENEIARLRGLIAISNITTTEEKKESTQKRFTVTQTSSTSFEITPLLSGTGTVRFIATLYNKSLVFSLNVNIAAKAHVSETINVVDDQYIYFDAIKNALTKANSSNNTPFISLADYNIITGDVGGAIYFTDSPDASENDAVERPPFIRDVVFEGLAPGGAPNIRVMSSNSTIDSAKTYYMHVKFTNVANAEKYESLPAGSVIEAVYPVVSGKVRVPIEINIDVRNAQTEVAQNITTTIGGKTFEGIRKTTNGKTGLDMTVMVAVQDLLDYLEREHASEYKIIIIRSEETTTDYFTYATTNSDKSILLVPLYNTPTDDDGNPIPREVELSLSGDNQSLSVTFYVTVTGILTTLPLMQTENHPVYGNVLGYGNIWIYSLIIVFGVLTIIFVIRFIVYFKKRAKQRAIIKRNQELIRMRDRMHNKGATATREQVVKTRLKMDDPKYAKMFREMKKQRTEENGGLVMDDDIASTTAINPKDKKKKKKKGGKKTVAELKAELEAKKAAFAAAQQSAQPVDPFVQDVPMDGGGFDGTDAAFVAPEGDFVNPEGGFDGVVTEDFGGAQSIDGSEIIFDATDVGDGV